MNSNDNITITFHVNGKPVEQELKKLEQQATELRTKMDAAFTAGDTKQYKKLEQQLKQVEKQTESVAGQHRRLNQTLGEDLRFISLTKTKKPVSCGANDESCGKLNTLPSSHRLPLLAQNPKPYNN